MTYRKRLPNADGNWPCAKCGLYLPFFAFITKPNGKPHSYCRECYNAYQKYRIQVRKLLQETQDSSWVSDDALAALTQSDQPVSGEGVPGPNSPSAPAT